jgi:hypothetical protein
VSFSSAWAGTRLKLSLSVVTATLTGPTRFASLMAFWPQAPVRT